MCFVGFCILLYVDDNVLFSDTIEGLQKPLDKVYQWNLKWKIKFNAKNIQMFYM